MKSTKAWLLIAGAMILAGLLLFGGVMTMLQWDFCKLGTENFETNTYEITDSYADMSVLTKEAFVVFMPSTDGKTKVICYETEKQKHAVSVCDGVLVITQEDTRAWYDHIGLHIAQPKITVYLPKETYGALTVKAGTGGVQLGGDYRFDRVDISVTTGDIAVKDLTLGDLTLSVSTGDITVWRVECTGDAKVTSSTGNMDLKSLQCKNLTSEGTTGKITMEQVLAAEKMTLIRSTGDISLEKCDAAEISIKTSTGNVSGSLMTDKVFQVKTSTGRVSVPQTTGDGLCVITTDTGNISIVVL